MKAAAVEIAAKHPEWTYKPAAEGVEHWMRTRAADFVTNVSQTQINGLRALITKASTLHDMSVDELSRAIRPMVGLTLQQSEAAMNYFTKLKENGVKPERAKDLTIRYSARMHRYRGYNIARTELAFGYNKGMLEATKQAQEEGYLGKMVKVWCTADDERVCHICGDLRARRSPWTRTSTSTQSSKPRIQASSRPRQRIHRADARCCTEKSNRRRSRNSKGTEGEKHEPRRK